MIYIFYRCLSSNCRLGAAILFVYLRPQERFPGFLIGVNECTAHHECTVHLRHDLIAGTQGKRKTHSFGTSPLSTADLVHLSYLEKTEDKIKRSF